MTYLLPHIFAIHKSILDFSLQTVLYLLTGMDFHFTIHESLVCIVNKKEQLYNPYAKHKVYTTVPLLSYFTYQIFHEASLTPFSQYGSHNFLISLVLLQSHVVLLLLHLPAHNEGLLSLSRDRLIIFEQTSLT